MAHPPDVRMPQALLAMTGFSGQVRPDPLSGLVTEILEHQVPAFVAAALDRLYGSLYASAHHLSLCEPEALAPHCWAAYRGDTIVSALLFRVTAGRVVVLTEMVSLHPDEIRLFCRSVFARYPQVHTVSLHAVMLNRRLQGLAALAYVFSENYILELPDSVKNYLTSLGKSTRKSIMGYSNRLSKHFPQLRWTSCDAAELSAAALHDVVVQLQAYKSVSMAARGRQAEYDQAETQRVLTLAADYGRVGIATLDGRIVAGSLSLRFGDSFIMWLAAADPELASYRLGMLTCFWSISDCISQQALHCHLLWGRYHYKHQLLAVPHPLYQIEIFRSWLSLLCRPLSVFKTLGQGWRLQASRFLKQAWQTWGTRFKAVSQSAKISASQLRPPELQ